MYTGRLHVQARKSAALASDVAEKGIAEPQEQWYHCGRAGKLPGSEGIHSQQSTRSQLISWHPNV